MSRQAAATTATALLDVPIQTEADDEVPPLLIQDVDPMGGWPGAESLPMPVQALPQPAVAGEQATADSDAAALPPEAGVQQVEFGIGAILAGVIGILGGFSRGRGLVAAVILGLARPFGLRRRFGGPWLGQQTARGLALLRLTLGILRLW